ncbi:MAG: erythromycin esterase family protein, partial [Candidatus Dormiibacterota bacterium]
MIRGIQQHAIPIRTTTPGGSDADLAALKRMVGNATVVGLGEESHGSHELIDLKARLVEYLISYRGFTTLVMENDWGSSQLLDKYINGGQGDLKTIMASSLFGAWQTR